MFGEASPVQPGAVPLVTLKSVPGIICAEGDHDAVAGDFGNDRSGRDRKGKRVAVNGAALWTAKIEHARVNDERIDIDAELKHRAFHGHAVSGTEADSVQLVDGHRADADGNSGLLDRRDQLYAPFVPEKF